MPSNVAHMLFSHKALAKVKQMGVPEYSDFVDLLDNTSPAQNLRAYMNLGSLGPDLFYYATLVKGALDMIKDGYVSARGVEPWSYHLHSVRPNEFPLKLVEITFRDIQRHDGKVTWEFEDKARLAFISGYLTHMAFDQIAHPLVNKAAGPYYRSGDARKKHRECEIFQDYFLYESVYRREQKSGELYDFFKQKFNEWADCITGASFRNTEDWFRYFIQRGFAETYNIFPDEDLIEDSVDNLLLTLRMCTKFGPYKKAAAEFSQIGDEAVDYKKYIADPHYMDCYDEALKLAAIYLIAFYEIYALLEAGGDFSDESASRFKSIVSGADLACPLEQNILGKAQQAWKDAEKVDRRIPAVQSLIGRVKFPT